MDKERRRLLRLMATTCALCPLTSATRVLSGEDTLHRALYWEDAGDKYVRCKLCPRGCVVGPGKRGHCGVRENRDGTYYTLVHSRPAALNDDPIEKKPLFHFRPGTRAYSLATVGCNIECRFCQNWELSQSTPEQVPSWKTSPEEIVRAAQKQGTRTVAFTYVEPTIFYEYMRDICLAAKGTGIGRVMISNGYINAKPLADLLPNMDAIKIDFKAFSESFYRDVCSAHLRPVLDTMQRIRDAGVWLELVMLVVPTLNDNPRETEAMSRWIVQKLGPDVPIHFTRFHPMYKLRNLPPTPIKTLEKAREIALGAGIHFAYAGNVPGHPGENTYCPSCKKTLIQRDGYRIAQNRITKGICPFCKTKIAGIWS